MVLAAIDSKAIDLEEEWAVVTWVIEAVVIVVVVVDTCLLDNAIEDTR